MFILSGPYCTPSSRVDKDEVEGARVLKRAVFENSTLAGTKADVAGNQ
jgi:hypothetical protein